MMPVAEETVFFDSGPLRLEGRLHRASGPDAVVLTHPHPLYGGAMDNPVVIAMARAYQRLGYSTLRFNFRGVGASGGDYGDGVGERDDAVAAAARLSRLGKTVTDLAGYSFGAWVNLGLHPPLATVRRQVLVAPPVLFMEFAPPAAPPAELAVIVGDQDRMAPLATLRALLPHWHPAARLCVVTGADHFFGAALDRLTAQVEVILMGRS
ncbi:MAG: alpha/beta hydrolase [Candidatus Contendobacter sp.]|nr:alpha/beta hydrolase [Candidatus Contendobacter sp.]MDG4557449.1 alpha/beta hydrolase [Candidatus Contendobacter sp.]